MSDAPQKQPISRTESSETYDARLLLVRRRFRLQCGLLLALLELDVGTSVEAARRA
jgi:hypothetical protein